MIKKIYYFLGNSICLMLICVSMFFLNGCGNEVREIPAGYIGKILMPTGWKSGFLEAGQVDLGPEASDGTYNTLILCEATSVMIKEQFLDGSSSEDKEDHRILTKNMTPLAVDFYIRVMLPDEEDERDRVFALITPKALSADNRVRSINLNDIYEKFAKQDVRGKTRAILAKYDDYKAIYESYQDVSNEISKMVIETFSTNGVPLKVLAAQLSNVKPDKQIWEALNKEASVVPEVNRIKEVGQALRQNPEYLEYMKWQTIKDIGEQAAKSGNPTIVIGDVGSSGTAAALLANKK